MVLTFAAADLPETIPVFPLAGALLLPRARLPLNIFEPRYLAMLDDALKTEHRLIGMIQPIPGADDDRLHVVGCAGRVMEFSETDDGRYVITLAGISRFRLKSHIDGFTPYMRARVDWSAYPHDMGKPETDETFDRKAFLTLLARYFDANQLSSNWDSLKEADEELLINSLSILCPFEAEEKQALLEAPDLCTRRMTMTTLMEFALAAGAGGDDGGALQ